MKIIARTIVVLAVVLLVGERAQSGPTPDVWDPNADLPNCSNSSAYFSVFPIAIADISEIMPAGGISPPDHMIPVHVAYFSGPIEKDHVRVGLPGNLLITALEVGDKFGEEDWYYTVAPCKQVRFRIHHVTGIFDGDSGVPQALQERADEIRRGVSRDNLQTVCLPGGRCFGLVNQSYAADTPLGKAWWDRMRTLNINVEDHRPIPPDDKPIILPGEPSSYDRYHLSYDEFVEMGGGAMHSILFEEISPSRTSEDHRHVRCVADYFTDAGAIRDLFGMGGWEWPVPSANPCGRFLNDVPNTLSGNWFAEKGHFIPEESTAMALIKHVETEAALISIGEDLLQTGEPGQVFVFSENVTGPNNLKFDLATYTPGSTQIYCYEGLIRARLPLDYYELAPGVFLFQFDGAGNRLRMEYQPTVANCAAATAGFSADAIKVYR